MKLVDVLQPQFIKFPLQKNTKEEVIKELIDVLAAHQQLEDKEGIFRAVLEREKIMTTGVGNGVAIPHSKHPACKSFSIALGIHPQGIDYQSIDGQPVKIVFLLIGPEDKPGTHIRLLSRISRIISKSDVREKILASESAEHVYQILKEEESKFFEINA